MKKDLPLLLLLSSLNRYGQKRIYTELKSYSLLYLMNADEEITYFRNTDKWIIIEKTLPYFYKKTKLYPTQSFNATRLNKTGRLKTIILPSLLKLSQIFGCSFLSGFLPIVSIKFEVNSSMFSVLSTVKYAKLSTIDSVDKIINDY